MSVNVDAQDNMEFNATDTAGIIAFTICMYGTRHLQSADAVPKIHCVPQLCRFVALHGKLSEHGFYYYCRTTVAATEELTLRSARLLQAVMHSTLPAWGVANVTPFIRNFVKIG